VNSSPSTRNRLSLPLCYDSCSRGATS